MKLLVVDDRRSFRHLVRIAVAPVREIEVLEAGTYEEARALWIGSRPNLVFLDVRLSPSAVDRGGLDLLRDARAWSTGTDVVVFSGWPEPADEALANRLGARYFDKREMLGEALLELVEAHLRTRSKNAERLSPPPERTGTSRLLGCSELMADLRVAVKKTARVQSTVLVRGDSGTGKELVARAIHEESDRAGAPFVALNCGAVPTNLLESLLFGHERGAFTGADARSMGCLEESADGTLFLDEIGELPFDGQAKLLRVLEERSFRRLGAAKDLPLLARLIAATHVDLEARVAAGTFRPDLYYRLNVVSVRVPPLAEHPGDIRDLVASFLATFGRPLHFTPEALELLEHQRWPGNIRQLRNLIERLCAMAPTDEITPTELARHADPHRR